MAGRAEAVDMAVAGARPRIGVMAKLAGMIRLMRPGAWVKNLFILAPLALTPQMVIGPWDQAGPAITQTLFALLAFCLIASAGYVFNDIVDRRVDQFHPRRRERPIAAGIIGVPGAVTLAVVLLACGAAAAWMAGFGAAVMALLYVVLMLAYSLVLKRFSLIDVIAVALGLVLRVDAGAEAASVAPNVWLVILVFLVGIFAALAKRRDDVMTTLYKGTHPHLTGYNEPFLNVATSIFLAASVICYIVFVSDVEVMARLRTEQLHLTVPFVIASALRYLQVTLVDEANGAPFELLVRDPFTILAALGWTATMVALVYG